MRITGLLFCAFAMVVIAHSVALSAPLDEICDLLREDALAVPDPAVLDMLDESNLQKTLKRLDPYAEYFTVREYQSPVIGREGWLGIGAKLIVRAEEVFLAVYKGGAADMAGVMDRSRLLKVDGKSVAGLEPQAVTALLKGEEGSRVNLTLDLKDGEQLTVAVLRTPFKPLDVELVPPGERQVLRIREFVAGMTRPALQATIDFFAQKDRSKNGVLIIDLRDSGGGDLYEAFDIAGFFLPANTLLGTIGTRGGELREIRSSSGKKYLMPLVCIVGPETASAAEIFAGALHQQGRVKLVGQRTYGKCSSQTDARLSDGSVLRYTNREVFLPGGDSCSGVGLVPDREVSDEEFMDLTALVEIAENLDHFSDLHRKKELAPPVQNTAWEVEP